VKYVIICIQILVLCFVAEVGDLISEFTHLPVPGSIVGMVLLFIAINYRIIPMKWIESGASFLIKELLLFFIPSAVSIIRYREILALNGIKIITIILISTITVIVVTGICTELIESKRGKIS